MTGRGADEILLGFTHALRAAGLPVTQDRATSFLEAATLVGADDPAATYRAGRATLCAGPEDLVRYGHVFEAWFGSREDLPRQVPREKPRELSSPLPSGEGVETGAESTAEPVQVVINPQGGVITKEAPIHISRVSPVVDGKPVRIGFQIREDGSKVRVARHGGRVLKVLGEIRGARNK